MRGIAFAVVAGLTVGACSEGVAAPGLDGSVLSGPRREAKAAAPPLRAASNQPTRHRAFEEPD